MTKAKFDRDAKTIAISESLTPHELYTEWKSWLREPEQVSLTSKETGAMEVSTSLFNEKFVVVVLWPVIMVNGLAQFLDAQDESIKTSAGKWTQDGFAKSQLKAAKKSKNKAKSND